MILFQIVFIGKLVCVTRILSKAEGVPPLWTWPKMVVRVSKLSSSPMSWKDIVSL